MIKRFFAASLLCSLNVPFCMAQFCIALAVAIRLRAARWAQINYHASRAEKEQAFKGLLVLTRILSQAEPENNPTLFEQSILLDSQGIYGNYFYAEFLYDEGKYKAVQKPLLIA